MIQRKQHMIDIDFSLIPQAKNLEISCLIVLNCEVDDQLLAFFVSVSEAVILCDGGANYFYETVHRDCKKIKAIVGDLDSIKPQIKQYYLSRNIIIQDLSHDQDTNDMEKSIKYAIFQKYDKIACVGALGGRFDQEMCNINILQRYGQSEREVDFICVGKRSVLLPIKSQMQYRIKIGANFHKHQSGMICFGSSKVETTGFKWNLGPKYGIQQLNWNRFVSSSNHIIQDFVTIHSSAPIIFSIQYKSIKQQSK